MPRRIPQLLPVSQAQHKQWSYLSKVVISMQAKYAADQPAEGKKGKTHHFRYVKSFSNYSVVEKLSHQNWWIPLQAASVFIDQVWRIVVNIVLNIFSLTIFQKNRPKIRLYIGRISSFSIYHHPTDIRVTSYVTSMFLSSSHPPQRSILCPPHVVIFASFTTHSPV